MQGTKRNLQVKWSDDKQSPNLKKLKRTGSTRKMLQAKEGVGHRVQETAVEVCHFFGPIAHGGA